MQDDFDAGGTSPCFMHELVGGHVVDPQTWQDVGRFRKAERARLYGLRRSMAQEARGEQTARVVACLDAVLGDVSGAVVAVYWPIRGELDLRGWMERVHGTGAQVALPVVVEKNRPVEFHGWAPGCEMTRGVWDIPVPAGGISLRPDIVVVPLVGVDREGYRLGNGGGYYDRTLAAFDPFPRVLGVGQDFCLMPTVFPQPWDIRMDTVILGCGSVWQAEG